ncbi:uncharacterized protein LOC142334033 [Lycorma delicatula]|uniref:uncharacterized protein LOC142334033 n=1 Tax=Lycorma delicatula TaxID=130591 RepID=UPI003F51961C
MRWKLVFFIISLFLRRITGLAVEDSRADKVTSQMPGSLSTLSSVLGALGFIKVKIMLSLITAFFIVGILSKLLGGLGTISCGGFGIACPSLGSGYSSSPTSYSQPDYSYYSPYDSYSRSQTDDVDFISSLAKSLDVMDLSFRIFGIEEEVCKRKFICMADNEALNNPIFDFAIKVLGNNLSKYREFGSTKPKKQDCNLLYPGCIKGIPVDIEQEFGKSNEELPKQIGELSNAVTITNSSGRKS